MKIIPTARPSFLCALAPAFLLFYCVVASAQEFRGLLSSDISMVENSYRGSAISGNTVTVNSIFENISGIPFVIEGIADVQSLDPEDLGFPDISPQNDLAARTALAKMFPHYDLYLSNGWVTFDPTRKTWQTEITFSTDFPILVNPGETFEYTRVSQNDQFGPPFGPTTPPLPNNLAEAIGEVLIAVDLDWHFVPEPSGILLWTCVGLPFCSRKSRLLQLSENRHG